MRALFWSRDILDPNPFPGDGHANLLEQAHLAPREAF